MSFIPLYKVQRIKPAPESLVLILDRQGRVYLCPDNGERKFRLPEASCFPALQNEELVELGNLRGNTVCGWRLPPEAETVIPESVQSLDVREALLQLSLPGQQLLLRAKSILEWLDMRRFCGVCGTELTDSEQEEARCCPNCQALFFPKISPAVIVLVTHNDRILLAHNRRFRGNIYSLIAGFVEAGESAEDAVRRELQEEVGIEVKNLRYWGSQSWPFPDSLMLGFTAEYSGGTICPDGEELSDADFYAPDALPELPRSGSIARRMVDDWLQKFKD